MSDENAMLRIRCCAGLTVLLLTTLIALPTAAQNNGSNVLPQHVAELVEVVRLHRGYNTFHVSRQHELETLLVSSIMRVRIRHQEAEARSPGSYPLEPLDHMLLDLLAEDSVHVRKAAARALAGILDGSDWVRASLIDSLGEPVPMVRAAIVDALGRRTEPQDVPSALLDALDDHSDLVRAAAVTGLTGKEPANAYLARALDVLENDASGRVRTEAVRTTADLQLRSGAPTESIVPILLEVLQADSDPEVRRTVIDVLAQTALSPRRTPAYVESTVAVLIIALRDREEAVRLEAVRRLNSAVINRYAGAATVHLIELLQSDPSSEVREAAAGILPRNNSAAVAALMSAVNDQSIDVRVEATTRLAEVGEPLVVMDFLIGLVDDPHPRVRNAALWGLKDIGPSAMAAVPALLRLVRDRGDDAQGGDDAQAERRAASDHVTARTLAIRALTEIAPDNPDFGAALFEALNDPIPDVRLTATIVLEEMDTMSLVVTDAIVDALQDRDPRVRQWAAEALGRPGRPSEAIVPPLIKALGDDFWSVQTHAAAALAQVGPAAVPALIERLDDANPRVGSVAADALGAIGPSAAAAVPRLTEALQSADERLRRSAEEALKRIQVR